MIESRKLILEIWLFAAIDLGADSASTIIAWRSTPL